MGSEDETVGRDLALTRAIGRAARRVFEAVYAGWDTAVSRGIARAAEEGLFVYRPAIIHSIRQTDPIFYRLADDTEFGKIRRLSRLGENGELLGY